MQSLPEHPIGKRERGSQRNLRRSRHPIALQMTAELVYMGAVLKHKVAHVCAALGASLKSREMDSHDSYYKLRKRACNKVIPLLVKVAAPHTKLITI